MKFISRIFVLAVVITSLSGTNLASASTLLRSPQAEETVNQFGPKIFLSDTGWSDPAVGEWDPATMTAKLTMNLNETIQMVGDNITLDGNGHTLTGNNDDIGVWVNGRTGVTVKNLTVKQFRDGIRIQSSRNSTVSGNTFLNNLYTGIYLLDAEDNTIVGNMANFNSNGIFTYRSIGNTLIGNTLSNNGAGIVVDLSLSFNIVGNEVVSNGSGIYLGYGGNHIVRSNLVSRNNIGITIVWAGSGANQIFNNNFIYNLRQAEVSGITGHVFDMAAPIGGNYWSNWTWPDSDGDGFVDNPFIFSGGQDNLPWTRQNGWETPVAPVGTIVTGGGWINSPAGAYIASPTFSGKATFSFVSSYRKDATTPTGQTEFHFKDADLIFRSASHEWLVVDGPKIQFKGAGTINGAGGYGFMLTVIDGQADGSGLDRFRIEIWDLANWNIIYDNKEEAELGGGSIGIHNE